MWSLVRNMCSLYSSTDFNIQMMQCSVLFSDSGTVMYNGISVVLWVYIPVIP